MSPTAHRIVFRLCAPLHSGWRKLGNLQQTRPYVTGRMLWGALTARLVRDANNGANYGEVGQNIDEGFPAFSYFYPSVNPKKVELWPWDDPELFSWLFLGSYASTALRDGHSAEEGMLHETEYIAPRTRDDRPVYLIGYLLEPSGKFQSEWHQALSRLQLGGERGYGWGRLAVECGPEKNKKLFGYHMDANRVIVPKGQPLLAHTKADGLSCTGTIEPLVGRVTDTASGSFGKNPSEAVICWVPGSKANQEIKFRIGPKGIWEKVS